jgi:hypothetical protein
MQQLLARALREITNGALGNAILEVGVYAQESELLVRFVVRLLESIVGESSVVTVIMLNFYTVVGGKGLKGAFGGDSIGK